MASHCLSLSGPLTKATGHAFSHAYSLVYKVTFILVLLLIFSTVAVRLPFALALGTFVNCTEVPRYKYHGTAIIAAMLIALACAARRNMRVSTLGMGYLRIAMLIASH